MIGGFSFLSESKRKLGNVSEDSFKYSEKGKMVYLAVADGVSRDPFNVYPDTASEKGKKAMAQNYPLPSLAKRTADIAVASEDLFRANRKIAALNLQEVPDPNWLKEDLGGCTAALAHIKGDVLHYQYLASCGIGVIGIDGKVRLQTPDEYWTTDRARWGAVQRADFVKGFLKSVGQDHPWWRYPEGRMLMRRFFRNKPQQQYSFGVLTGEKEAESYIRQGEFRLRRGDVVVVYSDGLKKPLFSRQGLRSIRERDFSGLGEHFRKNVDSEGTLVYWLRG